ncbi:transcriptional regulator [Paenibacillus albicereus]|uniref:transcriptional regulator n=1 Tax=Paenibacillus albicereus TaxID=2726185 RepID=UPI001F2B93B6|nr:transcriptional regulator [Paenibacillus albicereus]
MADFKQAYTAWLEEEVQREENVRRKERLAAGLGHGTEEFLRRAWFPAIGGFQHLHPEWEVRDMGGGCRYIDLAYLPPAGGRSAFEIQGYGPHARDLDVRRFKDLSWRHSYLSIDSWMVLPVAYPSIQEEPKRCQQLVLAFVGKFVAMSVSRKLNWQEAEILRYAYRQMVPFSAIELSEHLMASESHTRKLLGKMVDGGYLSIVSGKMRYRLYGLSERSLAEGLATSQIVSRPKSGGQEF